jgi:uncharacterized protein (TIGR03435 family)
MTHRIGLKLNFAKKPLASSAVAAVAAPLFILNALPIRAQAPAPSPAFEAASVKPNKSTDMHGAGFRFLPGGRFRATNLPLYAIIALAYDMPFQSVRLSGGPAWTRSERYDIEATAASDANPPGTSAKARNDKTRLMLQALLADRFKLSVRHETKELPAYVVVVGKNGPRLHPAKMEENDCPDAVADGKLPCHVINGGMGRGLHAKAVTVSDIVLFVENWADRPVIDNTGIQGLFEVDTDGFAPLRPRPVAPGAEPSAEDIAMVDPMRPTLFMIFDRLGLKMEQQRVPVDVFVIDNVEKPSEN